MVNEEYRGPEKGGSHFFFFLLDHVATRANDDLFFQMEQVLEIYTIHIGADVGGMEVGNLLLQNS